MENVNNTFAMPASVFNAFAIILYFLVNPTFRCIESTAKHPIHANIKFVQEFLEVLSSFDQYVVNRILRNVPVVGLICAGAGAIASVLSILVNVGNVVAATFEVFIMPMLFVGLFLIIRYRFTYFPIGESVRIFNLDSLDGMSTGKIRFRFVVGGFLYATIPFLIMVIAIATVHDLLVRYLP